MAMCYVLTGVHRGEPEVKTVTAGRTPEGGRGKIIEMKATTTLECFTVNQSVALEVPNN